MDNPLLLPIGIFVNIAPYAFLCYYPFMDKLKISIRKLLVIVSLTIILEISIFCFYRPITYEFTQCVFFMFLVVYFFIYLLTVRMDFSKLILVFLLNADYGGIIVLVSNYLEIVFSPQWSHIGGYSLNFFTLELYVATVPLGLHFMIKKVKPLLNLENTKAWGLLWVVPLMFFFQIILIACVNNDQWIRSWQYIAMTLTMAIGGYISLYVVSEMLLKTDENATLRQDVRVAKMQLSFQKNAYENLRSRIAETKAARHDLRHHLSVIESYLQSDNYDELQKYLAEYKSSLPDNKELFLCENSAANGIVLHYAELAKKEGITVTTNLHLPQKIRVTDIDLCIILGNCLENALEACRRIKTGQKYIVIKSKVHGDMLGITVDNSFDGKIESNNGRILSRKRCREEGLGLSSIQAVAQKYNGTVLYNYDNKEFQISVMLNMREYP